MASSSTPRHRPLAASRPERRVYEHNGQVVFEWKQTLDGVEVFIRPPDGVRARDLQIEIKPNRIRIGLKGNPPFMDEELFSSVVVKDSVWTMDGGEICLDLKKSLTGETWSSMLKGKGAMTVSDVDIEKKQMLLERFQSEHPGFDFSNADFTGVAPDAREFMGGMDYNSIDK